MKSLILMALVASSLLAYCNSNDYACQQREMQQQLDDQQRAMSSRSA